MVREKSRFLWSCDRSRDRHCSPGGPLGLQGLWTTMAGDFRDTDVPPHFEGAIDSPVDQRLCQVSVAGRATAPHGLVSKGAGLNVQVPPNSVLSRDLGYSATPSSEIIWVSLTVSFASGD